MGISSLKYNILGDTNHPQKIPLAGVFFLGQKGHLIFRHTIYIYILNTISFKRGPHSP